MEKSKGETRHILIFLLLTFAITWSIEWFVIRPLTQGGGSAAKLLYTALTAFVMLMPSVGVLLTRLLTREGFRGAMLRPNFRGNIRYYLMAWFGPTVLTLLGVGAYFLLFPEKFDPSMGYLASTFSAYGAASDASTLRLVILAQTASAVLAAPAINAVFAFGEEWGWRAYLVPKLSEKMPLFPMLLLSG
jgi:membrane protease YdiL (CAAX protease family)